MRCWATPSPTLNIKRGAWDDFDLMLFDKVIAYDHLKQKIVLVVNMKTDSVMENYGKACAALEGMAALINDQSPLPPLKATGRPSFTCNVTEAQYAEIVEKTREYIFDGDIFQAVQSRQFSARMRIACFRRTACSALPIPRRTWCSSPSMGTRSCVPLRKRSSDWITAV